MMSQESQHLHHHHPFNDFSAIVGTPLATTAKLGIRGHELLGMEMQIPSWASFVPEGATVSPVGPWQGSSSSMMAPHTKNPHQSLSLSLQSNIAHPPSFQFTASHHTSRIKCSKFLLPAQELLSEFCSLGGGGRGAAKRKICDKPPDESSSSWSQRTLYSMEPLELQKRKTKLLDMLEEVEKRYKRYCEQMKAVVSTFEDVAGEGAARAYSLLASMAMSRHFRRLRDGITGQLGATRKAMGEADGAATPGLTKGVTPRLRLLEQSLRQQRAFQQAGMAECHPWRPQKGLPERSVSILRAWLFEHFLHPYPSDVDKHILARQTGLSRSQVSNWFINARVRLWKPMVEEMYVEEMKEEETNNQSSRATAAQEVDGNCQNSEPGALQIEPHSLSSVVCSMKSRRHDQNPYPNPRLGIQDAQELTLGIQQHARPILFGREPSGDEGDAVAYRNLMGTQLLHDLTG